MKYNEADKERWVRLLMGINFFSGLNKEQLETFLLAGEIMRFKFHEYIFKEGEERYCFYVILKGAVKLLKLGTMNVIKDIGTLPAGTCLGEMGLLLGEKRTASALAADECYIYKVNREEIELMPEELKAILYYRFAVMLAERLKTTTESLIKPYTG